MKKHALVVDDNSDLRLLLRRALERQGYQVALAEHGLAAMNRLTAGLKPCVVILDLMMPVMSGHEFLSWKNSALDFEKIPVVVLTAQPSQELPGARCCLEKPVNLEALFSVVEECCCA